MYVNDNSNPEEKRVGDCVIRALAEVLDQTWERVYIELCLMGLIMADLPNANQVWGAYLRSKGYRRDRIPGEVGAYTVEDFCRENPKGRYVLAIDQHVVAVIDGQYVDSWDSGQAKPIFYWHREEREE